ncbi:MAG: glycerophosphodiester phosphodiesterase family protein [Candidatus Nanopelagicales bacterium]
MRKRTAAGVAAFAVLAGSAPAVHALEGRPGTGMLIIAHRGAPVYAAESTIGGYDRAASLGADLLEGDLVMSKDGRLVLCHDLDLSRITDVASHPEFAGRVGWRTFNGVPYTGYWVDDFTWDELKTLRKWDGQQMTTVDDLIWFAKSRGATLYLEIKESAYFQSRGLDPVAKLASTLIANGEAQRSSPFWIQSSNEADLRALRPYVGNRLVYLTRGVTPEDVGLFPTYRQFADVISVPTTRARRQLVQQAHAADLGVHVWTLRGSRDAYRKAAAIGADGVITDFPDLGVGVRNRQRPGDRPTGVSSRVENGNAVVTWTPVAGSYYAVTFDFGDPLEAPTLWTNAASASYPMADAKSVDITVSRFDGTRLGADAFTRADTRTRTYAAPAMKTRVRSLQAVVGTDAKTRITGQMERLKGKKWVPLRKARGWLMGRGEDVAGLRRNFRTGKKGDFSLTVQVREDVLTGYVPERSWMAGVTQTKKYKPSSSDWVVSKEGPPPSAKGKKKAQILQKKDVRIRRVR